MFCDRREIERSHLKFFILKREMLSCFLNILCARQTGLWNCTENGRFECIDKEIRGPTFDIVGGASLREKTSSAARRCRHCRCFPLVRACLWPVSCWSCLAAVPRVKRHRSRPSPTAPAASPPRVAAASGSTLPRGCRLCPARVHFAPPGGEVGGKQR